MIEELTNRVYQEQILKDPFYGEEAKVNEKIIFWIKKLAKKVPWASFDDKEKKRIYFTSFYGNPQIVEKIVKELEEEIPEKKLTSGEKIPWNDEFKISHLWTEIHRSKLITRITERIEIIELFNEIYKKAKEPKVRANLKSELGFEFKNRQEIFDEFAMATFTANPLRMRKIIEGVLGEDAFKSFVEKQTRRTVA
ncbi:hypothetical protein KKH59_01395 [Patescibacteria group bacterium]|nr:hypothetical protein [Patescibacteria group bacterium]